MKTDEIPFTLTALLGQVILSTDDYLDLQVGDILILDQPIGQKIPIRFGGKTHYLGTLGLYQTQKAVRCDERIDT